MTKTGWVILLCTTIMLIAGVALLPRKGSSQAWISIATAGVFYAVAVAVGRQGGTGGTRPRSRG